MKKYLLTSIFVLILPSLSAANKSFLLSSQEIFLSSQMQQEINRAGKVQKIFLQNEDKIWVLQEKSLLTESLKSKKTKKINFLKENVEETLQNFLLSEKNIFLSSSKNLFVLSKKGKVLLTFSPQSGEQKSLLLFKVRAAHQDLIFWLREKSLYSLSLKHKKLTFIRKLPPLAKNSVSFYVKEHEFVYILSHKTFHRISLAKTKKIASKSLPLEEPFLGLAFSLNHPFLLSRYSLLQLDLAGDIQRTIPIHGEQSLVIAHLNDKQHSFLFNDRILEVFDLDSKTKYQVYLNLGPVKKAHSLARYGSLYALNLDHRVRLFQVVGW